MRYTEYPSERDFREGTRGVARRGDVWSEAPGPLSWWVIPDGGGRPVLVRERKNRTGREKRAIAGEPAQPHMRKGE